MKQLKKSWQFILATGFAFGWSLIEIEEIFIKSIIDIF